MTRKMLIAAGLGVVLGGGMLAMGAQAASADTYHGHDRYERRDESHRRVLVDRYRLPARQDLDRDGIRNRNDWDKDGDGVPNNRDRFPSNPLKY